MTRVFKPIVALIFLAGCASEGPKPRAAPPTDITFFSGVRVIPGDGTDALEQASIIVENGKIRQIGKERELQAPEGATRVDLQGKTIMPMMVSLHSHLGYLNGLNYAAENYTAQSVQADLNRFEHYGIGAMLSLGVDKDDTAFKIRDRQRSGAAKGARLFTAGRGIAVKGGLPMASVPQFKDVPYQVTNENEARQAAAELAARKVDAIKIWVDDNLGKVPKLKPAMYRAVIDEAHKANIRVFSHVFALADAKDLVKSGLDGVAHSIRDREVDDEFVNLMKAGNIVYVPTLMAYGAPFIYAAKPDWQAEQAMFSTYAPQLINDLSGEKFVNTFKNDPNLPLLRAQYNVALKNLKKLSEAGVRIGFGTDSGAANRFPGYFEHHELELMVTAGLTPQQAITAATKTSAEVLGLADLGTLGPGKSADFIVLSANPLDDIRNSRQISAVYRNSKALDR
ncbi:MAG: amidohydrolase family protein [Acidobacteria bacterium]|nr:amidohydrolase family protein [Acidobacteriota bacterium]